MASKEELTAGKIFFKTMPFVWAKLLLGIATIVVSIILLAILLGIAALFKSEGVALVMIIIWLVITGIVRFILNHWLGYLIKAGHIAVITEAVTAGTFPEHQVKYGMQAVKERFLTANIYFAIDKLVGAAVRQIQRVVGKVTGLMSALPGMGAVTSLAKFFVNLSLGYIDECCLGYTFYKGKQKAFKSAADGVVIYAQNIKTLLANAAKTMAMVVLGLAGITLVLFLLVGLIFRLAFANSEFPGLIGFIAFLVAVILAVAIKYAFMDSFILIRTMTAYMKVAPKTTITVDLYEKLSKTSSKFKELLSKDEKDYDKGDQDTDTAKKPAAKKKTAKKE